MCIRDSCTRAAIWKAVKSLREEGYTIEAGQNKGYMLVKDSHRLSMEAIQPFLVSPEVYLKVYQEIDSTNRAAKEAAVTGLAGHGGCVVAGKQTAGRGRRGRSFYSPEEAGLYLSVILKPRDVYKRQGVVRDGIGGKTDSTFAGNLFHDGSLADSGWSDQENRTLTDRGHEILSVRVFTRVDLYRV